MPRSAPIYSVLGLPLLIVEDVAYHHGPTASMTVPGDAGGRPCRRRLGRTRRSRATSRSCVTSIFERRRSGRTHGRGWAPSWTAARHAEPPPSSSPSTNAPRGADECRSETNLPHPVRRRRARRARRAGPAPRRRYRSRRHQRRMQDWRSSPKDPNIAVVVSDMRMPGMDGATFLHARRRVAPTRCACLLTGQADLTRQSPRSTRGGSSAFSPSPVRRPAS